MTNTFGLPPLARPEMSDGPKMSGTALLTVAPSALTNETARSFVEAPAFKKFGEWGDTIIVAHRGVGLRLIQWLALHRHEARDYREAWDRCLAANPGWFVRYQTIRLCRPSFFLPAGEVVFQVLKNPTQIPDQPPQGVLMRHWEAMTAVPEATFYFLRPVFTHEGSFGLVDPDELREEAESDRDDAIFAARLYGAGIRTADWCRRQLAAVRDRLAQRVRQWEQARMRRQVERTVRQLGGRMRRADLARLLAVTDRPRLAPDMAAFRRTLLELRARISFDPILCFEVPQRPGELWFEAHWYQGRDGRMYVGY